MKETTGILWPRRKTRQISVGGVLIGGGAPIVVQSMTKTDTRDARATIAEIGRLEKCGCQVVRLAVPDREAADALGEIRRRVRIPLIADIHFNHMLALAALDQGVDGLRLNPGTIGSRNRVKDVVRAARDRRTPIRIGVNSGSLEKMLLRKYGGATAEAMVESALGHIRILEDLDFCLIKVSLKASDVPRTLDAYRLMAKKVDYPFHAGITEAGTILCGAVKSAVGIALLLNEGLADTVRVSLTAAPEEEVRVAFQILSGLGLRQRGPNVISCPTCGRVEVNLRRMASEVEKKLAGITEHINVAVMGCMVNGPGEAKEADVGIACGKGIGVLFKRGRLIRRLKEKEIVPALVREVDKIVRSRRTENIGARTP